MQTARCAVGLALALTISPAALAASERSPQGIDTITYLTIGGGKNGEPALPSGTWTFDLLSDAQQSVQPNCFFTTFKVGGEIFQPFAWKPSPESTLPPDFVYLPDVQPEFETENVKGWALRFLPAELDAFPPGALSLLESPFLPLPDLGVIPGTSLGLRFSSNVFEPAPSLVYVAGIRYLLDEGLWTPWQDVTLPVEPGPNDYAVTFGEPVPENAVGGQVRVGAQNEDEKEPAPAPDGGPAVDEVEADAEQEDPEPEWKLIPDVAQTECEVCQVAAFTNCFAWWSQNGYPELRNEEGSEQEKNEDLRHDLAQKMYGEKVIEKKKGEEFITFPDAIGDAGATRYLRCKNVYRGQEQPEGRQPLKHSRWRGEDAQWEDLVDYVDGETDVIINVYWYNADGERIDDVGHSMTVSRIVNTPDDKCIYVSNPWGESTHTVTNDNASDVYDKLDVTVQEDGSIRIDNETLETQAAGVENAEYLCVDSINVVAPVEDENRGLIPGLRLTSSEPVTGGVRLNYEVLAEEATPTSFVAVVLDPEVAIVDVASPEGWTAQPLPVLYPDALNCGQFIGPNGVAWNTDSNPIVPGDLLEGFSFTVLGTFDVQEHSADGYAQAISSGTYYSIAGPVELICPADLNGSGVIDVTDLLQLLAAWGPCTNCVEDLDGSGSVDVSDLLQLLAAWGPCA